MYELVYHSIARHSLTSDEINQILKEATENNPKKDITGCLLYHSDEFVQVLEGDQQEVEALFQQISQDERHHFVTLIYKEEIKQRQFADWSMAYHHLNTNEVKKMTGYQKIARLKELIEQKNKVNLCARLFSSVCEEVLQR